MIFIQIIIINKNKIKSQKYLKYINLKNKKKIFILTKIINNNIIYYYF